MELEADLALIEWVLWLGAFILAMFAYYLAQAIAYPVKHIPYVGGASAGAIEHLIADPVKHIADAAEKRLAKGLATLAGALELVGALAILLGYGVYKALGYLWHTALKPLVFAVVNPVHALASQALTKLEQLTTTVEHNLVHAETYAREQAAHALADARTYADHAATTAGHAAERYADEAVAKLRAAEDAAVASAVKAATDAKRAGEQAAAAATTEAEGVAAKALAQSEAVARSALSDVRAIAIGAEHELTDFEAYVKGLDLAKVIAGSAALASLVSLVLAETGLENQACRGKVKQVCGTDPAVWENLLGLLAPLGLALSLRELVKVANGIAPEAVAVIKQAA